MSAAPSIPPKPTWAEVEVFYAALRDRPLTAETLRTWLSDFSALDAAVDEAYVLAMIAYTANTGDAVAEATYLRWATEILPPLHEIRIVLGRRMLDFADLLPDLEIFLRELRTDVEIFRAENLPRMAALEEMEATYDKIAGGLVVQWAGETKTIPELYPYLLDRDRSVRERAYRLGAEAYLGKRGEIGQLFHSMVGLRHAMAREAGFANFRDYAFAARYRFDYSADDCLRFHDAVEATVLPAIVRLQDERRRQLGVETLRPWDLNVLPERETRLTPFTTTKELVDGTRRIFDEMDSELGTLFRLMVKKNLLDLENRPGKAPGGYCTRLPLRGDPFIFMNAVGVNDDVSTLAHESGHAFHAFLANKIPYMWQRMTGLEASELASVSMELMAAPRIQRPTGFYSAEDAAIAQIEHLEDSLLSLPHIASVDAFQHWIYTDGVDASPHDRDQKWVEVRTRFEPGIDYRGLELERITRWYRQSHIHTVPFYYIEYGIAQLGALQIWRRFRRDPADALRRYKAALSVGNTRPLPEIFGIAGASLVFDQGTMGELVSEVETRLAELRVEAKQLAA